MTVYVEGFDKPVVYQTEKGVSSVSSSDGSKSKNSLRRELLFLSNQIEESNLKLMAELSECRSELDKLRVDRPVLEEEAAKHSIEVLATIEEHSGSDLIEKVRDGYHKISGDIYKVASLREKISQTAKRIAFEDTLFSALKNSIINLNSLIRSLQTEEGVFLTDSLPGNHLPENAHRETEKSVLLLQEEEKRRLAVAIHDEFVQNLANMVMKVDFARKLIGVRPEEADEEMVVLRKEMQRLLDYVRKLIFEMSPMSMVDLGFVPTVERFVQTISLTSPFKVRLVVEGSPYNVGEFQSIVLFRIIQESVNNISAHSCAGKVVLTVDYSDESRFHLSISDDGIGFDTDKIPDFVKLGRVGIHTMISRVDLLDGTCQVESQPGEGTVVKVDVPVRSQ